MRSAVPQKFRSGKAARNSVANCLPSSLLDGETGEFPEDRVVRHREGSGRSAPRERRPLQQADGLAALDSMGPDIPPAEGTLRLLPWCPPMQVRTLRCDTLPMAPKRLPADITDVQEIMGSICDKWALLILHQLSLGTKRHGELRR